MIDEYLHISGYIARTKVNVVKKVVPNSELYYSILECGACRIGCSHDNIDWKYPRGGFGVQFRLA